MSKVCHPPWRPPATALPTPAPSPSPHRELAPGIAKYFTHAPDRASCGMATSPPRPGGNPPTPPPDHEAAAEAVRRRRLTLGWTQDQLAERSGVSAATVRKLEAAAQRHYRDLTCTRLCAALGWEPDVLDALRAPSRTGDDRTPREAGPAPVRPPGTGAPPPGGPRRAELAALNGRLAQLDERQWDRLVAFVDGLTADDR